MIGKLITCVLAAVVIVALAGCGGAGQAKPLDQQDDGIGEWNAATAAVQAATGAYYLTTWRDLGVALTGKTAENMTACIGEHIDEDSGVQATAAECAMVYLSDK